MNNIQELSDSTLKQIQDVSNSKNGFAGVPSGYKELDNLLCGFDNSDLIVLGARPAMGKSAFVTSIALNMALADMPIAFYSLEMSARQLVNRFLGNLSGVEVRKIKNGKLNPEEWNKVVEATKRLNNLQIYIDDSPCPNIEDFCTEVKKFVDEHPVKAIFIDYLQLFMTRQKCQNRYEEVSLCTRMLKRLAKEINLPIIVTSQLNRSVEKNTIRERVPEMYDLRDSGTICDDANVVMLLHRPEYYVMRGVDECGNDIRGIAEINIAKNHMGPIGSVRLRFVNELCKFENWSESDETIGLSSLSNDLESTQNPF